MPQASAAACLANIFSSMPGPSWDVEADPAQRRTKHVYQQLLIWRDLLLQQLEQGTDPEHDAETRELIALIKGPIATLKTRLSSTPARARAALLHSIDHGAATVAEFVTETRLARADVVKYLRELIDEKVIDRSPDGRSQKGRTTADADDFSAYLFTRAGAPGGDAYAAPAPSGTPLAAASPLVLD